MSSIASDRDLVVPMRDGVRLFANLFRPAADGRYPVVMSVTPYGKDKLPDRVATFFMRLSGVKFGNLGCSRLTGFEAPDPVYCVQQGYAVLQADVRGMHKSEGRAGVLRPLWFRRLRLGRNRKFAMAEDFLTQREGHPTDDAYWASKRPVLENIGPAKSRHAVKLWVVISSTPYPKVRTLT